MPGEAKEIKLGHNSILTKQKWTLKKNSKREKIPSGTQVSGRDRLFEILWKLELLLRMQTALSSRDLRVTYSEVCALCIAQMAFCGVTLPLVERAVTFFSMNPSCPFHICWQITIFFPSYVLSRGTWNEWRLNFNSSRRNLTPKGGVMLKKVLVAFCRSGEMWGRLECVIPRFEKTRPCPGKTRFSGAFMSLNVELLMLMIFWQFLVCQQSSKVKGNTWGLRNSRRPPL